MFFTFPCITSPTEGNTRNLRICITFMGCQCSEEIALSFLRLHSVPALEGPYVATQSVSFRVSRQDLGLGCAGAQQASFNSGTQVH